MKICPKCGSTEVIPSVGGITGSWKCKKCGFSGTIFPEVEKLGKEKKRKIKRENEKKWKKR